MLGFKFPNKIYYFQTFSAQLYKHHYFLYEPPFFLYKPHFCLFFKARFWVFFDN